MKLEKQLHGSATHKAGNDPACPACNPLRAGLRGVIKSLQQCANTNAGEPNRKSEAHAVAHEQRRMVGILKDLLRLHGGAR
jgi:hypothetical protein